MIEIRVFCHDNPVFSDGDRIQNSVSRSISVGKIQGMNGVMAGLTENVSEARREMRVDQELHPATRGRLRSFRDRAANWMQA